MAHGAEDCATVLEQFVHDGKSFQFIISKFMSKALTNIPQSRTFQPRLPT